MLRRDLHNIAQRHGNKQQGEDSLASLLRRRHGLYRAGRLAIRGIVAFGMDLPPQRAGGVLLCLERMATRATTQR
jgi:hypothetical protein